MTFDARGQVLHGNGFDLLGDRADPRLHAGRWLSDAALRGKLDAAGVQRGCQRGRQRLVKVEMRREQRREE
jgi:hypothetical protein